MAQSRNLVPISLENPVVMYRLQTLPTWSRPPDELHAPEVLDGGCLLHVHRRRRVRLPLHPRLRTRLTTDLTRPRVEAAVALNDLIITGN